MKRLLGIIRRKTTRRKAPGDSTANGASKAAGDGASTTTPPANGEHVSEEPEATPLTKEELLADLRVEYEDAEDDAPPTVEVVASMPDDKSAEPVTYSAPIAVSDDQVVVVPETRMGKATPYSASMPLDDDQVAGLEAGADSTKRSYLSITPTTIQSVSATNTLLVWHATFHPAVNRRFSSVIISVKFTPAPPSAASAQMKSKTRRQADPSISIFAPRKSFGATSKEQRTINWGLELPVSVPAGPVSLGVTPSGSKETSKEVEHAFTITGSTRGVPQKHTGVWTVEENASTERGIPSELQIAALVTHPPGGFVMEVDISGWTAGGYLPSHHLRPKSTALGRRKAVDPSKFKGLLFEYDLGKDGMSGVKGLMEKWTGRVEGAVLEFDQNLAMA